MDNLNIIYDIHKIISTHKILHISPSFTLWKPYDEHVIYLKCSCDLLLLANNTLFHLDKKEKEEIYGSSSTIQLIELKKKQKKYFQELHMIL